MIHYSAALRGAYQKMKKQNKKYRHLKDIPLEIRAEMALKEAVADAMARHKQTGNPIAVWRDGKAVWIPPEEIVVPEIR